MAAQAGIEPATKWLTVTCSTAELPSKKWNWGLETDTPASKATSQRTKREVAYKTSQNPVYKPKNEKGLNPPAFICATETNRILTTLIAYFATK